MWLLISNSDKAISFDETIVKLIDDKYIKLSIKFGGQIGSGKDIIDISKIIELAKVETAEDVLDAMELCKKEVFEWDKEVSVNDYFRYKTKVKVEVDLLSSSATLNINRTFYLEDGSETDFHFAVDFKYEHKIEDNFTNGDDKDDNDGKKTKTESVKIPFFPIVPISTPTPLRQPQGASVATTSYSSTNSMFVGIGGLQYNKTYMQPAQSFR